MSFLRSVSNKNRIITAIDTSIRFPELLKVSQSKYASDIALFKSLVQTSSSSAELLEKIRSNSYPSDTRMSLLKIFRRAVSPILDTEMAKKISKVKTADLVESYGSTFTSIDTLKSQFSALTSDQEAALAALIGEYDSRGQVGYVLTDRFFNWFESTLGSQFTIDGPRGAGRDIELSSIFTNFTGSYPCDFVIRNRANAAVLAVGFARYDSTRGGAQSDDRTGGNADKVSKALNFCRASGNRFRIIFLSDGPGLLHNDTWEEACRLDESWGDNVRVTTLITAPERITPEWLLIAS